MIRTVLVVLALVAPQLPAAPAAAVATPTWTAGDVHVHIAGDSGLEGHVRCHGTATEAACAERLARQVLQRAKDNHASWIIATEHVPWLAVKAVDHTICVPKPKMCKTIQFPENDMQQARHEYQLISATVQRLAPEYGVRALMGQEMGTAGQVTLAIEKTTHLPKQIKDRVKKYYSRYCSGVEAGHLGVYYADDVIDDSVLDCDENRYLTATKAAGGWGAINHPDNQDQGSRWYCWQAGDVQPYDRGAGPDHGAGTKCTVGAAEMSQVTQAVEIINDRNAPSIHSLDAIDNLLSQGHKVALVGGGDAHTARPDGDLGSDVRLGPIRIPSLNWNVGRMQPGNDGKIGLVGRTWIPGPIPAPVAGFNVRDLDDPVRAAIKEGRTIASTGPPAAPSIGGQGPSDLVILHGNQVTVRVDLGTAEVARGSGVIAPEDPQPVDTVGPAQAEHITTVVGAYDVCEPNARDCGARPIRHEHSITDDERSRGYATFQVPVPENNLDSYLRTETVFGNNTPDTRYPNGQRHDNGAYSSPIYLASDDRLKKVDWKKFVEHCPYEDDGPEYAMGIDGIVKGDIDGDGLRETLVIDSCGSTTSSWPQNVEVFDGRSNPAKPTRLGELLDDEQSYPRGGAGPGPARRHDRRPGHRAAGRITSLLPRPRHHQYVPVDRRHFPAPVPNGPPSRLTACRIGAIRHRRRCLVQRAREATVGSASPRAVSSAAAVFGVRPPEPGPRLCTAGTTDGRVSAHRTATGRSLIA